MYVYHSHFVELIIISALFSSMYHRDSRTNSWQIQLLPTFTPLVLLIRLQKYLQNQSLCISSPRMLIPNMVLILFQCPKSGVTNWAHIHSWQSCIRAILNAASISTPAARAT